MDKVKATASPVFSAAKEKIMPQNVNNNKKNNENMLLNQQILDDTYPENNKQTNEIKFNQQTQIQTQIQINQENNISNNNNNLTMTVEQQTVTHQQIVNVGINEQIKFEV